MANPVASRTAFASAFRIAAPVRDSRRARSTRFVPETSARTGTRPAKKRSDFTIWPTWTPIESAASCAVRVEVANSSMRAAMPAVLSAARTRSGAEIC